MYKLIEGNLLDSKANFICHQVNCQGVMGSGVAWQIRNKWPIVFKEYINKYDLMGNKRDLLGYIQAVKLKTESEKYKKPIYVVNMFTQYDYGKGERYTNYEAFYEALVTIKAKAKMIFDTTPTIAFPYKIGCDRGGANWNIINTMIYEVLNDNFNVEIYKIGEAKNESINCS